MSMAHALELPLREPVAILFVLLLLIWLTPALAQRLKMPGIVGLMLGGAILGPHGFGIIERGEAVSMLGAFGLVYLMFWAGLEIDLRSFRQYRYHSLVFGLLTFSVPLVCGIVMARYVLGYPWLGSILLSAMFSTHTLIAYPIVTRLRLVKDLAVQIAVGGTIITDTLALLVLSVVTNAATGELDGRLWLRLGISITLFSLLMFGLLPPIARWFFRRVETELTYQYAFVLLLVFFSAFLAELAGLEAIIGAFFAGVVLSRVIPHTSTLMDRIAFGGHALFVPLFLVSVGMLVDLLAFWYESQFLLLALGLTVYALATKWIAARLASLVFGFSRPRGRLLFGLSSAHAAATIAIILIGYDLGLLDRAVLNAVVLLILITCLVSSFVTDRVGRAIALDIQRQAELGGSTLQRILVPFANPNSLQDLTDFSLALRGANTDAELYPISVILDDEQATDSIRQNQELLAPTLRWAADNHIHLHLIHRIDLNVVSGLVRSIRELLITDIVIGWKSGASKTEKIFGSVLDNLVELSREMIFVVKLAIPLAQTRQMLVLAPPHAEAEAGFAVWVHRMQAISEHLAVPLRYLAPSGVLEALRQMPGENHQDPQRYRQWAGWPDWWTTIADCPDHTLLVIVSARSHTVSYHPSLEDMPEFLAEKQKKGNFILVFPAL